MTAIETIKMRKYHAENKVLIRSLIKDIYLSDRIPDLDPHSDFATALNKPREFCKALYYMALYSWNVEESCPYVISRLLKSEHTAHMVTNHLVKSGKVSVVDLEIAEDIVEDKYELGQEKRKAKFKELQELRMQS